MQRQGRWAALAAVFALGAPAAASAATAPGSVAIVSEGGDWIGDGGSTTVEGGSLGGTVTNGVFVEAGGYRFELRPAAGQALAPGEYDEAVYDGLGSPGFVPSVKVTGPGRACSRTDGRFTIKALHTDGTGQIDGLWALFEQRCDLHDPVLFGELRLGTAATTGAVVAQPSAVRWPVTAVGHWSADVPVRVVAGAATHVTSVALTGLGKDAYVLEDHCTGATLAAGGHCDVDVRVHPTAGGRFDAELRATTQDGDVASVALDGRTPQATVTTLAAARPVATYGEPLTFTAALDTTLAVGDVTFSVDDELVDVAELDGAGQATSAALDDVDVGATVTAAYRGERRFAPSTSTLHPVIQPAATRTTVTVSGGLPRSGDWALLTARVANASTAVVPFGSVQFSIDGAPVRTPVALDPRGIATASIRWPAEGIATVRADYRDDTAPVADFVPSSGALGVTVRPALLGGPLRPPPEPDRPRPPVTPQAPAALTLQKATVRRDGTVTLIAQATEAGRYAARATTTATGLFGTAATITASEPKAVRLVLKPTKKALAALKALSAKRTLELAIAVTFTARTTGTPVTAAATVKVAGLKRPKPGRRR